MTRLEMLHQQKDQANKDMRAAGEAAAQAVRDYKKAEAAFRAAVKAVNDFVAKGGA